MFQDTRRRAVYFALLAAAALCGAGHKTMAQAVADKPIHPITWVVGWPPGGSVDSITRIVAKHLGERLGQSVIVENRPGASGGIGLNRVAMAAADGYTMVTVPGPVLTTTKMPAVGDELVGVAELARGPMVLVGTTAREMPGDVRALFQAIKKMPGRFDYASSGNGTSQHLTGELVKQLGGLEVTHIPYKGGSQAVMDVISGQVTLGVLGIPSVLPHIRSGKLRAYAVTSQRRAESLPDTPTLGETVLPGFHADQWFVVAAPKGTPADRIEQLNKVIGDILLLPDVKAGFESVGVEPSPASPADTTRFVMDEQRRWQELATDRHLPLN